jgi:hypothetical protein
MRTMQRKVSIYGPQVLRHYSPIVFDELRARGGWHGHFQGIMVIVHT